MKKLVIELHREDDSFDVQGEGIDLDPMDYIDIAEVLINRCFVEIRQIAPDALAMAEGVKLLKAGLESMIQNNVEESKTIIEFWKDTETPDSDES